jgi:predicted DNA-binding protein YlxM (UPF0122 family)
MVDGFSADELASKYDTSTASIYDAIKYVAGFNLGRYIDLEMSPKEIATRENIDVETVLQLLDL